jgi:hypothetical protein
VKCHLPIEYAADLTAVVAGKEEGVRTDTRKDCRTRQRDRGLASNSSSVFSPDRDPTLLFDANRFAHPYLAISDRPIDLRQVPVSNLPVRFLLNAGGRFLGETLCLAQ